MKNKGFFESAGSLVILLVILVALNVVIDRVPVKADMTEEGLYTLSDGTRAILKDLKHDVKVKFYFSESSDMAPTQLKSYGKRVKELLQEFVEIAGSKMSLEVIDPKPDTEEEEWAQKYSIEPFRMPTGDGFYLGAVFISPFGEKVVSQFNPMSEELLEYDIIKTISQGQVVNKKRVGILSNHLKVFGNKMPFQMPGQAAPSNDWQFISELKESYDVVDVAADVSEIPDVDVLVVIHPVDLSDKTLYAVDQYAMNHNGSVVFCVDPSAVSSDTQQPQGRSSNVARLFTKWGIQYSPLNVVTDLEHAVRVRSAMGVMEQATWLQFERDSMNKDMTSVAMLDSVMLIESGSISQSKESSSSLEFIPLIETAKDASSLSVWELPRNNPAELMKKVKKGDHALVTAGVFKGRFDSAFEKAPEAKEGDKAYSKEHKAHSGDSGSVVVIADSDFLSDRFTIQKLSFFGLAQKVQHMNDNLNFFNNLVEAMAGDPNLISIRSRGKFHRPFDRVDALLEKARDRWKEKEAEISSKLEQVRDKISKIEATIKDGRLEIKLDKNQMKEIESFKEQERRLKREQRIVRRNLREDIESLGQWLTLLNVFLFPFLVGIFGAWRVFSYSRKGVN